MAFNPRFDPFNPDHIRDLPDVDFSNIDWNDPASIFGSLGAGPGTNLPIPKMISPAQVKKEARERSRQIFKDWELLNAILDRHEPTILKRWTKKSRSQRVKILLDAWPNMSATHRPDFLAFRSEAERQREAGTTFREAYMWPQINQEDLSKSKTLLFFLQARARYTPDVFAMADSNVARLGFMSKAIVPAFLNEHTMMFTNRKTPEKYGELVPWGDDEDAFEWLTSGKGMHPGNGLIVLEMQERIMRFLVDCCKGIMHDVSADVLTSDDFPIQPAVTLPRETVDGFASLSIMAAETPYRSPANMDLERLESLFDAQRFAIEDHIWALREDPDYFANTVQEAKEHRQEILKDANGHRHPLLKAGREGTFWQRVVGNVVASAHLQLEVWTALHAQVQELRVLQAKHGKDISIDKDLPEEYLDALLKFQHYLNKAAKGPKGELKHGLVASPPMRQFYVRAPPRDPSSPMIQIAQKPGVKMDKVQGELLWLLKMIWEDDHQLFFLGLTNVVDELERLIQSEPKARALISPYVADVISNLSVTSEGLRQLQMYQPWAQTFETSLVGKEEGIKKEFVETTKDWGLVMGAMDGPNQMNIVRLGQPEERKFYHPVERRRTKENVEAMRSAEQNLDAFWSAVDKNMRTRMGKGLEHTALWRFLSKSKILNRTPEWIEPEKQPKQTDVEGISKPLSELYFDLELRTERTVDRSQTAQPTPRTKTRGAPATPATASAVPQPDDKADKQPTFQLDIRALKVFRALFYVPSLNATPGEVPWTDFLHAMASTGFEPQKLYGSVWLFSPTKPDVERSIQFHEPHPSKKLPYKTARRFGRRLNRAYSWEGDMFVLRD
ncbi:hypothetical protein K458DRAFT_401459 [Lentithecium fluviatile CBS 122367]|uniref:Uncharacterized protein n=1 Tax=Lentithecium fluviatile CBS 122367 TaxID=1168545 RepID=A0A6G1JCW3_9PLEO|nr:hypothetical protein K458DRAFT_401459 [Lentithecium fluviatile CBS 122367]